MSKLSTLTPIAAVLAVAVTGFAHAAGSPFSVKPATGIVLADAGKEGHCGAAKEVKEAKCGADKAKMEGKCGEGKCGAKKAAHEGKCGADKAKEAAVPASI